MRDGSCLFGECGGTAREQGVPGFPADKPNRSRRRVPSRRGGHGLLERGLPPHQDQMENSCHHECSSRVCKTTGAGLGASCQPYCSTGSLEAFSPAGGLDALIIIQPQLSGLNELDHHRFIRGHLIPLWFCSHPVRSAGS